MPKKSAREEEPTEICVVKMNYVLQEQGTRHVLISRQVLMLMLMLMVMLMLMLILMLTVMLMLMSMLMLL